MTWLLMVSDLKQSKKKAATIKVVFIREMTFQPIRRQTSESETISHNYRSQKEEIHRCYYFQHHNVFVMTETFALKSRRRRRASERERGEKS